MEWILSTIGSAPAWKQSNKRIKEDDGIFVNERYDFVPMLNLFN